MTGGTSSKIIRGLKTTMVAASDLAKEARNVSTVSTNGRSRKNKYSNSQKSVTETENGATKKGHLCNRDRSRKKLLCLQRIWAHGLTLQK